MPGTLCLTFDDLFVENWLAARPVFKAHDARVTFFVSHLHLATPAQIDGLLLLQEDGHEIGYHTRTHPKLRPYLDQHGLDHWLKHEIDDGMAEHRAYGFPAHSFGCTHHSSTPETRASLSKRFKVIRTKGPRTLNKDAPESRIYHSLPDDRCLGVLGFADMQHRAFPGWPWTHHLLDTIAQTGGTAILTGHDIQTKKSGPGFYSTQRQIGRLLEAASARDIATAPLTGHLTQAGP